MGQSVGSQSAHIASSPAGALTEQERAILRLVVAGKTNREIGAELRMSRKTVAKHLSAIFAKLGVTSRTAAAVRAVQEGWVAEL